MVKLTKKLPEQPFYLSRSEEVNIKWGQKYASNIEVIGRRYGVSDELIAKVLANNLVLQSISTYETLLGDWMGQWRDAKNSLMYQASSPSPILLPEQPKVFPALPSPVNAFIFGPFIQSANIILANPDLSEADRNTLGLVKAAGKPVTPEQKKRERASAFNFPVMNVSVKNGLVKVKVTRGDNFRGKAVLVQVDRDGKGNFFNLGGSTTANELTDSVVLPSGVLTASWTYRAIYVEGVKLISDWSPNHYVSVASEPIPIQPVTSPNLNAMVQDIKLNEAVPQDIQV